MQANRKDLASGAFFVSAGLFYGGIALRDLPMGSALEMGPGYFPLILSGLLIALGSAVGVRALSAVSQTYFGPVPWRGVFLLTSAILIFAVFFDELGMFPGIFVTAFVASLSSPHIPVWRAVVISLSVTLFCTAVFSYGIRISAPVIGPMFGR